MSGFFQNILEAIYGFVGNYGWSIVLFTLLVRLVLLPLDIKSKKSMRAMTKIQPKVQALQKKYANDKDKLNLKLNELYRKEKVSPMASCLPMLISLPILWFMFAAMRRLASEHTVKMIMDIMETGALPESFESWLWIKNVFQPDSFSASILPKVGDTLKNVTAFSGAQWATTENIELCKTFLASETYANLLAGSNLTASFQSIPLIFNIKLTLPKTFADIANANGLFILPLLSAVSQFLMTKFTGNSQQSQPTNAQDANQQAASNAMNSGLMKWFFPLFSLYICAQYNAAFAIYWMAANVIQIIQQVAVNWYFDRKDRKAAAAEAIETEFINK